MRAINRGKCQWPHRDVTILYYIRVRNKRAMMFIINIKTTVLMQEYPFYLARKIVDKPCGSAYSNFNDWHGTVHHVPSGFCSPDPEHLPARFRGKDQSRLDLRPLPLEEGLRCDGPRAEEYRIRIAISSFPSFRLRCPEDGAYIPP